MADFGANKGSDRRTRSKATSGNDEDWLPLTSANQDNANSPTPHDVSETEDASLHSILSDIKAFRRDNNQQLAEIKKELLNTNDRLEEAEGRIEETDTALQAMATLMKRLMNRQAAMETKLTDQEGRACQDNLPIHGIPEREEGNNICAFLEKLLKDTLDIPNGMDLKIERAHRSRAANPIDTQVKPRSIIAKFSTYKFKEEVIRRAWQRKAVYYKNTRFFVDHDYPAAVLKVLRERKIKFQSPYPAKLRVHYEDDIQTYQNAAEATVDMARRGLPVTIITTSAEKDHRELQLLASWQTTGDQRGTSDADADVQRPDRSHRKSYKGKLQQFKYTTHPTN